jgi:hypothetical protein
MAANFPASLQQKFNEQGFSNKFGETVIRTNVEVGPAKVRRRYTKAIDLYRSTINLKYDDWQTLKDFYDVTLNGGALPFNFENPMTQTQEEFRFVTSPDLAPLGGEWFRVTLDLERLPQ